MPLDIRIQVDKKDLAKLSRFPKAMEKGLLKGMRKAMFFAESKAKQSLGTAGKPDVVSGHLRRSIESGARQEFGGAVGWIGSNVIYARIQELGGVIKPRAENYLKFQIEGQWVTLDEVRIPARPYLTPAIEENIEKIKDLIASSVVQEIDRV